MERIREGELIYSYRITRTYIGMASPTKGARTTGPHWTNGKRENPAPRSERPK